MDQQDVQSLWDGACLGPPERCHQYSKAIIPSVSGTISVMLYPLKIGRWGIEKSLWKDISGIFQLILYRGKLIIVIGMKRDADKYSSCWLL